MTRYSCLIESYIQANYGITIEAIPLCPKHAFSLCDSHEGALKPKMRAAEIQDRYPDTLLELKNYIESEIADLCVSAENGPS